MHDNNLTTKLLYARLMEYRSDLSQIHIGVTWPLPAMPLAGKYHVYITSGYDAYRDNFARHIVIRVCDGINRYTRQS